jgi:hypothetical protein
MLAPAAAPHSDWGDAVPLQPIMQMSCTWIEMVNQHAGARCAWAALLWRLMAAAHCLRMRCCLAILRPLQAPCSSY